MNPGNGPLDHSNGQRSNGQAATTVLIAVTSAKVREALVAMLGTLDGYCVVAEADSEETALEAARNQRPRLALIETELSGCSGWWVIQQIQAEHLADAVVALGRRADGVLAQRAGAHTYVQMGSSPRDLLSAVEAAISIHATAGSAPQTEDDLLSDAYSVL